MICPSTRAAALGQLAAFIPKAPLYARDRNHVQPGHPAVSRLSPAIRHRLISEDEVAAAVLGAHAAGRVEKFVQEVYWRRYWKGWLSLRPQVWRDYLDSLAGLPESDLARRVEAGQSGNAVIDHFANELVATGYLHNHARMWFAAWWVHEARLPWQSGAAFFFKHLLDGDPAANTLSWRWVAGLQTPGKTYLARRSNLEKYLAPGLLESLAEGLNEFEHPQPHLPSVPAKEPVTRADLPASGLRPSATTGLWIHEEDLSPETSPLAGRPFAAILVTGHPSAWENHDFPAAKRQWLLEALHDGSRRAADHWKTAAPLAAADDLAATLAGWAKAHALDQIVTLRPDIGPLDDALPGIAAALSRAGIHLAWIDRPRDLELRPLATGGFFQFWERLQKRGGAAGQQARAQTMELPFIDFP
jgi:deoxyribodipyrimidine photo-lyase